MSPVTFRIKSNVATHGIAFAVRHEINRAQRRGLGYEAAVSYGIELVKSSIRA